MKPLSKAALIVAVIALSVHDNIAAQGDGLNEAAAFSDLATALKNASIVLDLKFTSLSQNNPEGSTVQCEASIKNNLPIDIKFATVDRDPPFRIHLEDVDGKPIGPQYQDAKINRGGPPLKKEVQYIEIKSTDHKVYKVLCKDDEGAPMKLKPGNYRGFVFLPVFLDPETRVKIELLRSKVINFSVK